MGKIIEEGELGLFSWWWKSSAHYLSFVRRPSLENRLVLFSVWPFELASLPETPGFREKKLRRLLEKEHVKRTRLQPFRIPSGRLASTFMKNALRSSEIRSKSLLPHHPLITSSTYAAWNVSSSWALGVHGSVLKSSAHPSQQCEVKAIFVQTPPHPTTFVSPARDVYEELG